MSNQRRIVIILLIGLLSTIIAIIPEILGDDAKAFCEQYFGENYKLHLVLFFIVGSLLLVFLTTDIQEGIFPNNKKKKQNIRKLIDKSKTDLREWLTISYRKQLNNKLASRLPINLQLKYSLVGTTTKAPLYENKTIRSKLIKEELISVFDKHRGRLLIIGEAGAGKTTLLLQLAINLLEQKKEVIPIIINFTTWRSRFNSVEDWLNELLPQMGISNSLTTVLIQENLLLPLFDGLDELKIDNRKSCLEAIGDYGRINDLQYVICSRIVEYTNTVDAPVYCQIEVRPLTFNQIKNQIRKIDSPESIGMLHAIKKDKALAEIVKIPFYFNLTQLLFSTMKTIDEFEFKALDLEDKKKELIQFHIKSELIKIKYPSEKSRYWLSFIGYEMTKNDTSKFELLNLQYNWGNWTNTSIVLAIILKGVVFGLFFHIIGAIIFSFLFSFGLAVFYEWKFALLVGISSSVIVGVMAVITGIISELLMYQKIRVIDFAIVLGVTFSLIFTPNHGIKVGIIAGLISCFIFYFLGIILKMVRKGREKSLIFITTIENKIWSHNMFFRNLQIGFIVSSIFGLICFSLLFLSNTQERFLIVLLTTLGIFGMSLIMGVIITIIINNYSFIQINKPYQRFISSAKNLYFSILQHLFLRFQLYKKGFLPLRLVNFLNDLSQHHLIESDGARWNFRHRILQDHFAEIWKKQKIIDQ